MNRAFFVVNPNSGGGQTGRIWQSELLPQVRKAFPQARWAMTRAAGQGAAIAQRAWQDGAELVVAVGGDGSVNEVVNGLMECPLESTGEIPDSEGAVWPAQLAPVPRPILGIAPRGTGCDLGKTLGVSRDFGQALEVLKAGQTVQSDLCSIEFLNQQGNSSRRYSINICGCAITCSRW